MQNIAGAKFIMKISHATQSINDTTIGMKTKACTKILGVCKFVKDISLFLRYWICKVMV